VKNVPPNLSNVVTALAKRRLMRVASYGRVRGGSRQGEVEGNGKGQGNSNSVGCFPDYITSIPVKLMTLFQS